eukprot:7937802-Pyramimonas_sp.AAC.1
MRGPARLVRPRPRPRPRTPVLYTGRAQEEQEVRSQGEQRARERIAALAVPTWHPNAAGARERQHCSGIAG